jgi:hypothetical protein
MPSVDNQITYICVGNIFYAISMEAGSSTLIFDLECYSIWIGSVFFISFFHARSFTGQGADMIKLLSLTKHFFPHHAVNQ